MRSNYAGMAATGQIVPYSGRLGEIKCAEQAVVLSRVSKSWTEDRKTEIRKYWAHVGELRRVRDGINEWIQHKPWLGKGDLLKIEGEFANRVDAANRLMKALVEDYRQAMMKAGVTTSLGYNFYDLRPPALLIYPVNVPLRNQLPRWGAVNAGVGTIAHWKSTTLGPGTSYAGALEGERVAYATPNEVDSQAYYKELGVERSVTFTAEFAGEGFTSNVADEHIRGLHELWLQEESILWYGNPGTATSGQNGFVLGTANTPTCTRLLALPSAPAGTYTDGGTGYVGSTTVSVRVVELTALGYPNNTQYGYQAAPTVTAGLTPSFTRTNADNTTNVINGGMGAISAASNVVTASSAYPWVLAEVSPKAGAHAWAWFIDTTDATTPTTANAYLTVITTVPFVYLGGATLGTYAGNSTGLSTDHSWNVLDFAGVEAWDINNGTYINMSDLTKTSAITGTTNNGLLNPGLTYTTNSVPAVAEIEYDLLQQWNTFQWVSDEIWCDATTKRSIEQCLFANTSGVPAYRFDVSRDGQGNLLGGFVVSGYKNLYSMKTTGAEEIPIRIHPMLAPGSMIYRLNTVPYPHSRMPGVSGCFVQRDYYGIEWPVVTRAWTFGTYVHEVYGDYLPGILTERTGIIGAA